MAIFVSVILGFSLAASSSTSAVSTSASSSSSVSVSLSDIIALRLLDTTATDEITEIALNVDPNPSGVFTKGSLLAETSTSNPAGYSLYLTSNGTNPVGDTSDNPTYTNALVNVDTSVSDTIPTLDFTSTPGITSITERDFSVAKSLYRNRWGYSTNAIDITQASGITPATITDVTDASAITYADIPAHNISRAIETVDTTADSYLIPVTIGANISSAIDAGIYKNTLEFTVATNTIPTNYSLTFNMNGSDSGNTGSTTPADITESTISNMPSTNPMIASSVATSYTFTIPSTEPETSASGYEFKEWNTSPDGTSTSYAPGDEFTITVDDLDPYSPSKTIYAIWGDAVPIDPTFNITYMQEMTSAVCDAVTTPASASVTTVPEGTLIDYRGRDGTGTAENPVNDPTSSNYQTYKVRKLYDDNCWMAENLQLNLVNGRSIKVGTFDGGEADWTPNSNTSSTNPYNIAITQNYKENIAVTDYRSISHNNWYYTWYGATTGQGANTSNPSITQSICPKGWRLPLGGDNTGSKSFYYLITTKYGQSTGSAINNDPLNFYPAGSYSSGSQGDTSYGYYWSASPYTSSSSHAYNLSFGSGSVYPQNYFNKYYGFSVRCVSI